MRRRSVLNAIGNGIRRIGNCFGYLGAVAMCLMAVIVTIDVTGRYFFNHPLKGGTELVEVLMVCVIFFMFAYVTEAEKHIKVDVFISFMERKTPRLLWFISLIFDILVIFVLALLTRQGFIGILKAMGSGEVTDSLEIPHYPFRFVLTAGFAVAFLASVSKLIHKLFDKQKGI